jgi:hypothetical protein
MERHDYIEHLSKKLEQLIEKQSNFNKEILELKIELQEYKSLQTKQPDSVETENITLPETDLSVSKDAVL